jgi:polar amino acid transport system substrate-binding protein
VRRVPLLILVLWSALQAGWVMAQNVETKRAYPGTPLIVGFSTTSLDVVKRENPRWLKSYIDFWDLISQELKRPYVFTPMPFEEILKALREGAIDITAVPVIVSASREELFDLSTPLGGGRLAVATRYRVWDHPWLSVIQIFFSWTTVKVILMLIASLVLIGIIAWLIERKENPEYFGQGAARGIGTGIFWAGSTLASGICLGISLKTPLGRILGLFWMVVCVVTFGAVIASLTYYLGSQQHLGWVVDSDKLKRMHIGGFRTSAQAQMIERMGIRYTPCDNTDECVTALTRGKIDGFLYDEGYLRYLSETRYRGRLSVYATDLKPYRRAFAMPKNSPLRKPFNVALLKVMDRPMGEAVINQLDLSQYVRTRPANPMEEKRRFGAGRGKR